jgi:hypothetical protein
MPQIYLGSASLGLALIGKFIEISTGVEDGVRSLLVKDEPYTKRMQFVNCDGRLKIKIILRNVRGIATAVIWTFTLG